MKFLIKAIKSARSISITANQMRIIFTSFLLVLLLADCYFLNKIDQHFSNIEDKVAFNIDTARSRFLSTTKVMFMRGCEFGVDYPPEYRESNVGFNVNSPQFYCEAKSKEMDDYVTDQLYSLGRSK